MRVLLFPLFVLLSILSGCAPRTLQDKPLQSLQTNLLTIAAEVASALPVQPHLKDRSRAQEAVVATCFELEQPQRALACIEKIGNWRRGKGYADYALYSLHHGITTDVEFYLNQAEQLATLADQEWRRDEIKTRIENATHFLQTGEPISTPIDVLSLDDSKLPRSVFVENRMALAESALELSDVDLATQRLNEARGLLMDARWPAEYQIPWMANIAALRVRCAERQKAQNELQEAVALFNEKQDSIVNIYRAETLIPIAEAFQALEDSEAALRFYARALEASIENPNSRPRAEDLSAICRSMALHAVEPTEELWSRIREIKANLADPW